MIRMLRYSQERLQLPTPVTQLASAVLADFAHSCMSFRGQEMQRFWAARLDGALQRSTVSNLFSCFSHRPQVVRTQLKNTKTSTLRASR